MGTNEHSKSGLYNWVLCTIKDILFDDIVAYFIADNMQVSDKVTETPFMYYSICTLGFSYGTEMMDYARMLDKLGIPELNEDVRLLDLIRKDKLND